MNSSCNTATKFLKNSSAGDYFTSVIDSKENVNTNEKQLQPSADSASK